MEYLIHGQETDISKMRKWAQRGQATWQANAASKWATFCAHSCCYDTNFSLVFSFSVLLFFDVVNFLFKKKNEGKVRTIHSTFLFF